MTAMPDFPLPADLVFDEPPISDADLERWEASVLSLADDASMDVPAAAEQLLEVPDDDEEEPSPVRRWRVEDDNAAEWALRQVAAAEQERRAVDERYAEWTQKITVWRDRSLRPLDARLAFFRHHLTDYAARRRAETGKATLSLPSGKVSSRRNPAAPIVVDETAVIAWARANLEPDACAAVVKVVESVLVTGLREFVALSRDGEKVVAGETGELVPGTDVRPESVSFTVSAS